MSEFSDKAISVSMLRVIRVIRFIPLFVAYSPQLKMALQALYRSRIAAFNLCILLFLIIFVYALIGVGAFGNSTGNVAPQNDQISFHNISGAIIILTQIGTTAGWDGVYDALIKDYDQFVVFLYLWSFLFICIMIILNLMLNIILSYYKMASEENLKLEKLSTTDFNDFNAKWKVIAASNQPLFIKKVQLPVLMNNLDKSSSLCPAFAITDENIQLLGIPIHNEQQLYYGEVLIALNRNRLKQTPRKNKNIED